MGDEFENLRKIVHELRQKCPWDKEQTEQTLAPNITEEAQEIVDAIGTGDVANLREEIGDVILVALMIAEIASEKGDFTIDESLRAVSEKMKRRHPHVFGDATAETAQDALRLFHEAKAREKQR